MALGDETSQGIDRRKALTRIGSIGTVGVVGAAGFGFFSRPAFALDAETFSAADVAVSSKNGKIDDIWLKPALTYSWDGLDSNPSSIEFSMSVEKPALDGGMSVLGSETDTSPAQSLEQTDGEYTFENELSLLDDGPWRKQDFRAKKHDSPKPVGPIDVAVTATLTTEGGETFTDSKTDPFTVSVTNLKAKFGGGSEGSASGGVGGKAGTGADGFE